MNGSCFQTFLLVGEGTTLVACYWPHPGYWIVPEEPASHSKDSLVAKEDRFSARSICWSSLPYCIMGFVVKCFSTKVIIATVINLFVWLLTCYCGFYCPSTWKVKKVTTIHRIFGIFSDRMLKTTESAFQWERKLGDIYWQKTKMLRIFMGN